METAKMIGFSEYALLLTTLLVVVAFDSNQPHVVLWSLPVLALALVSLLAWTSVASKLAQCHNAEGAVAVGRISLYLWAFGAVLSLTVPLAELVTR